VTAALAAPVVPLPARHGDVARCQPGRESDRTWEERPSPCGSHELQAGHGPGQHPGLVVRWVGVDPARVDARQRGTARQVTQTCCHHNVTERRGLYGVSQEAQCSARHNQGFLKGRYKSCNDSSCQRQETWTSDCLFQRRYQCLKLLSQRSTPRDCYRFFVSSTIVHRSCIFHSQLRGSGRSSLGIKPLFRRTQLAHSFYNCPSCPMTTVIICSLLAPSTSCCHEPRTAKGPECETPTDEITKYHGIAFSDTLLLQLRRGNTLSSCGRFSTPMSSKSGPSKPKQSKGTPRWVLKP
jgi:hypothetical protein